VDKWAGVTTKLALLISGRMASSGMLRRKALVRTYVSEELSTSFISVTGIGELGTILAVTSNRRTLRGLLVTASVVPSSPILVTLMKDALISSETLALTRATRRNVPEDYTFFIVTAVKTSNLTYLYPGPLCRRYSISTAHRSVPGVTPRCML
jgi:hypothetical protein